MLSVWGTAGLTPALTRSRATQSFGVHPGTLPNPRSRSAVEEEVAGAGGRVQAGSSSHAGTFQSWVLIIDGSCLN